MRLGCIIILSVLLTFSLSCETGTSRFPCPEGTTGTWKESTTSGAEADEQLEFACLDRNGLPDGPVLSWAGSRLKSVQQFQQGKRNGTAVAWGNSGLLSVVQTYSDGEKIGLTRIWNVAGELTHEIEQTSDGRTEIARTMHPNGSVRSTYSTVDGSLEGDYRSWFPSGELHSQGAYKDGKKDGLWSCQRTPGSESIVARFNEGTVERRDESASDIASKFKDCAMSLDKNSEPSSLASN